MAADPKENILALRTEVTSLKQSGGDFQGGEKKLHNVDTLP